MIKKRIKINMRSSWEEIKMAQEIIGQQKEIIEHMNLCKTYNFDKKQTESQIIFMYGKDYKSILNTEIII